jgi:hypothetical protein
MLMNDRETIRTENAKSIFIQGTLSRKQLLMLTIKRWNFLILARCWEYVVLWSVENTWATTMSFSETQKQHSVRTY